MRRSLGLVLIPVGLLLIVVLAPGLTVASTHMKPLLDPAGKPMVNANGGMALVPDPWGQFWADRHAYLAAAIGLACIVLGILLLTRTKTTSRGFEAICRREGPRQ